MVKELALPPEYTPTTFLVQMFITALILGSLTGIILSFGVEYEGRGFLQDRLVAFLHSINNQALSFFILLFIYRRIQSKRKNPLIPDVFRERF
jgi:hypothetical protein